METAAATSGWFEEAGPAGCDWAEAARCRGQTKLFFAPHGERPEARRVREEQARAVCRFCPVMIECRRWARHHREYGFWGGESEEERALAGYFVALPIGRVAQVIRIARRAATG